MAFGEFLQQAPQPNPQAKSEWDTWFQDPAARAGLLSFGLSMLAGGWGSGQQQFAQAVGQGTEAAAGTAAYQNKQQQIANEEQLARDALTQRASEGAADRTSREKIAKGYQEQRLITAGAGAGGTATLTRQERQFWDRTYSDAKKRLEIMNTDPNADVEQMATQEADQALAARQARFGAGKTSPNSESGAPPVSPAAPNSAPGKTSGNTGSTPAGGAQAGVMAAAAPPGASGLTPLSTVLAQFANDPARSQKLQNLKNSAQGRQLLISKGIDPNG